MTVSLTSSCFLSASLLSVVKTCLHRLNVPLAAPVLVSVWSLPAHHGLPRAGQPAAYCSAFVSDVVLDLAEERLSKAAGSRPKNVSQRLPAIAAGLKPLQRPLLTVASTAALSLAESWSLS